MKRSDKNRRLEEVVEKYKENALTKQEFQEFILLLNTLDNLDMLDNILSTSWNMMPQVQHYEDNSIEHSLGKKENHRFIKWSIAASILAVISVVYLYFHQPPKEVYTSYQTDYSQISECKLPDGSIVTLNANSQLSWNNEVTLNGEAFFDVETLETEMTLPWKLAVFQLKW
jgi:hypothetical protein